MTYAINENGYRAINSGWTLELGETEVEDIPQWLLDKLELQEMVRSATSSLDERMRDATIVIQPLQDDLDLGDISPENEAKLKIWKRYRSTLGKTQEREGWPEHPDWPELPESASSIT